MRLTADRLTTVFLRSWVSAALVVLVALVGVVVLALVPSPSVAPPSSRTGLGTDVESVRVERAQADLPGAGAQNAVVVWDRADGEALSAPDLKAVAAASVSLADLAGGEVGAARPAPDGTMAVVTIPLRLDGAADGDAATPDEAIAGAVDELRTRLDDTAPPELEAMVTGAPAFAADLTRVFDGADTRLLLATVLVVGLLLLLTYRSPVLVVVPLLVVGATEQTALALAAQVLPRVDLPGGGAPTGIASVLVFGAATNYALLIIARYREQLRREVSPLLAMRQALGRTGGAILASGGTVLLALSTLLLTGTEVLRAIAVACIFGVALAMLASLVVLPAVLVLIGRRAFWPFVPRVGAVASEGRVWSRIGSLVAARPARVLVVATLVLLALSASISALRTGLTQDEQFRSAPEAVVAAERLAASLPAGASEPVAVITTPDQSAAVVDAATEVDGVASAAAAPADGENVGAALIQVDIVLDSASGSEASRAAVADLRTALDDVGDGEALVGGAPAEQVDVRATNASDRLIVIPLILALVGLVLVVLLRALLAPVLLVATVVLSYTASLGTSWFLFDRVLGYPGLDGAVIVLSFLFLVALGIDYNIFLTTRAREEAREAGTRAGMLRALTVTGPVITSAGLLLAAVFAVLGVLPLILLTQLGVIVGVGVLIDTLLVRTVVVPALALILGERFWWPGRPHRAEVT